MSFVPSSLIIGDPDATHMGFILHGVLGSKQNWRSFAAGLQKRLPDWCLVLTDTRHHGGSRPAPPPDTIEQCAVDLRVLTRRLGREPTAVIGHSLGGKIALDYARLYSSTLQQVWSLDSPPASMPDAHSSSEVVTLLSALASVPLPLKRREDVVPLLKSRGISDGIARWTTTSMSREQDGYRFALDLDEIHALVVDYASRDVWPFLEQSREALDIHLVIAEQSERYTASMRERARGLPGETRVKTHLLPNAGHWLHTDNPQGLTELLVEHLRA